MELNTRNPQTYALDEPENSTWIRLQCSKCPYNHDESLAAFACHDGRKCHARIKQHLHLEVIHTSEQMKDPLFLSFTQNKNVKTIKKVDNYKSF